MKDYIVTGDFVEFESGTYYRIENVQEMPAFFINIASSSDVWVFLSSNGALTAGRQNAEGAMFPYETDDRLHLATSTGPKTLFHFAKGQIWEPFNTGHDNPFTIRRNLYKRITGDSVIFEEINESLNLTFTYQWETSEKYGLVRTATIKNQSTKSISMTILDGVENIIPYGITQVLADSSSCLTDAYKACERLDNDLNLTVFSLTSVIVDTPEPIEVLRACVAWRIGKAEAYLLSSKQIHAFASGKEIVDETNSVGRKGAFLACQQIELSPDTTESWMLILDAKRSQKQISELLKELKESSQEQLSDSIKADIVKGTKELVRIVAAADGLQKTADTRADVRHYMNVLYNNMRGGVFIDGYSYDVERFKQFVSFHNRELAQRRTDFFDKLNADLENHANHTYQTDQTDHSLQANHNNQCNIIRLHELAYADGDTDLIRLSLEFLPLAFSRRHGDPSRPWNRFNVQVKDDNGERIYHYEGNWRDIFQNWEAMVLSFPGYLAPIITKFLNASTPDGFNPYRISEDGVDWEVPQPDNPFSGYGYWGDHQIVYLTKLLEWLDAYAPDDLGKLMTNEIFTYANVPYKIKPFAELLKDGKDTLIFDAARHKQIMEQVAKRGADAKLLPDDSNGIYHASFIEKIIVPVLAKLSNLVIGGGIWMNTHRPEWNDANNAIVGYGLSMVTVYQLYRHLKLLRKLIVQSILSDSEASHANQDKQQRLTCSISIEVLDWLEGMHGLLKNRNNKTPRSFLDEAGAIYEHYHSKVYAGGFSGKQKINPINITDFINDALETLTDTIKSNKRDDGMYNAYNVLTLTKDSLSVSPLFLMLEGQTAVLGSGYLTPGEAVTLVEKMENSGLMSDEHNTFFLYPRKVLKTFMERNIIPDELVQDSQLLTKLLADGHDGFIQKDANGTVRFHDSIRQSSDLEEGLSKLFTNDRYNDKQSEADNIRDIYEKVFIHREFTGRSGIMYKYEGIGSIYWHQNSKFILSFQEIFSYAADIGFNSLSSLKEIYYRLRAGLGFNKEPSLWGAFPLEPYSHTPYNMPAQQPGMTGQVKEDILTRNTEMGILVRNGLVIFSPALLRESDFLVEPEKFIYIGADGKSNELSLETGSLAFTICQTPVIYRFAKIEEVIVFKTDGEIIQQNTRCLDKNFSSQLFSRSGMIKKIEVTFNRDLILI